MSLVAIFGSSFAQAIVLSFIGLVLPDASDTDHGARTSTHAAPRASSLLPTKQTRPVRDALLASEVRPRRQVMLLDGALARTPRDLVSQAPQRKLPRTHRAEMLLALHTYTRPELLAPRVGKAPLLPLWTSDWP